MNTNTLQIIDLKDPDKFITKIISPETLLKKRLMAKELSNALQKQMEIKKLKKEEEKKKRFNEESWYEKKLKEKEELSSIDNLEELKTVQQSTEIKNKVLKIDKNKLQTDPLVDTQMKKLKSEMEEKEKIFNDELLKLKQVASANKNGGEEVERKLTQLKDHIIQNKGNSITTSYFKPELKIGLYSPKNTIGKASQRDTTMGRYGKLYFTEYNKPLKHNAFDNFKEQALLGESQMIPWRSDEFLHILPKNTFSLTSKIYPQDRKLKFNKLDDIMKEFLSEK